MDAGLLLRTGVAAGAKECERIALGGVDDKSESPVRGSRSCSVSEGLEAVALGVDPETEAFSDAGFKLLTLLDLRLTPDKSSLDPSTALMSL